MRYILLFPGLAIFSFNLLLLGGIGFPIEFKIFDRRIHELESFTISGGKSLANLSEIYVAIIVGLAACVMLYLNWPKQVAVKKWSVVWLSYLIVVAVYFLMPALPE
ncbi:hypothetical protein [Amphritea atlantica]|uniref:hypothetical protein n=1 Tax=Amphritea atlantica TaxID=355243 RepID=UPI000B812B53|nr:hypothetical protein [Amphritea atlantica]